MKNIIRSVSIVGVVAGLAAVAQAAPPSTAPSAAQGAFQKDLVGVVSYTEKHILELEDAFPQNKFNYRPGPGVRSVAETFLHIAFANYGMIKMSTGKEPPAEAGWEMNPPKWEKKTTDKAEIKKILEQSFAFAKQAVSAVPDADLDKQVNFFGHEMSTRSVFIILVGHVNEHLGQEVAYARTNKIVPPWSKEEHMPTDKKSASEEKPAEKKTVAAKP
jgi:uncharacterized damage-inducible protein DinB